jgi:hypothetical protein
MVLRRIYYKQTAPANINKINIFLCLWFQKFSSKYKNMLSIFLLCLSTPTRAIVMVHLFNGSVLVLMTRGQTIYLIYAGGFSMS